jgi:hypothetical protein
LEEIHANLVDRLQEAKDQGWLGEVAAIETTMVAAALTRSHARRPQRDRPPWNARHLPLQREDRAHNP